MKQNMYKTISMSEFDEVYRKKDGMTILDVREEDEYKSGHIPGARSAPLSGFPAQLEKGKTYYVVCQSGGRSTMACQYLARNGHDVVNVMGGMSAWRGETE